jgi:hypothetical protein
LDNEVYTLTNDEMRMLEQGKSHEEIMQAKLKKLKNVESELSKRKKTSKTWGYGTPQVNIKFKVKSIDIEDDKAIVTVDIYDVLKREGGIEVPTTQNYLKGEIPNITPKIIEDNIKSKLKGELKDYIGTRFRYTGEDSPNTQVEFKFNHLKK